MTTKNTQIKIKEIRKREGTIVPFDIVRVENAITKAFDSTKEGTVKDAKKIATNVSKELVALAKASRDKKYLPSVELIQDLVETELMSQSFPQTAKAYILYRKNRAEARTYQKPISEYVRKLVDESSTYFKTSYAEYIFYQMYSRWIPELGRRETWIEAIDRFMDFMRENLQDKVTEKEYAMLREG